ncbi:carboxypeptidase regulatory-like domain-containing protein [Sphingomonas sp. UBA978]|uniref:carboxypeptidase regulatory-like domain-containing protein n=1 Tax=Sphingomonas sp. UBA978 TaxID=1947536 RepID=UPI0025CC7F47|nr:carboxypeptidase regulatory-like domain-containing protein [Sphingomonas sp. UBA978]
MTPERITAALLGLAVVAAWLRLWRWQRRGAVRSPRWRIAALAALQAVVAGLLYMTLFAPSRSVVADRLAVATAGAPHLIATAHDETLVALPEAGAIAGARREPDLGTALRHHPGAVAFRIVGSGLVARDRPAAMRVAVRYAPPPVPQGLVALTPPAPVAPGARFAVVGRVEGGAAATLRDPAGRIVDTARPAADGTLVLHGTARVPGAALFTLQLAGGDAARVPLVTIATTPAKALILAGAPGPEVKFLRRWAADAGLTPQAQLAAGGGLTLGDPPASYAGYDLAILDDRSWAALGGGARAALAQAVRGGMGLVVRLTGPVPRGWQVFGLAAGGGAAAVPLRLAPAAPSQAALAARRGPGSRDAPADGAAPLGEVPELSRIATTLGGIPLLRDARGTPYAAWRNVGRGRVAVVTLLDSFALVTSGNGDAHADLWSTLATTVGRGTPSPPDVAALAWAGERTTVCGLGADARATAPDGTVTALIADPASSGCAGYWPLAPGWHRVAGRPLYVQPADSLPQVRAAARRDATLALVGARAVPAAPASPVEHGPSWRWFLPFLAAAGLLWWLERRRR